MGLLLPGVWLPFHKFRASESNQARNALHSLKQTSIGPRPHYSLSMCRGTVSRGVAMFYPVRRRRRRRLRRLPLSIRHLFPGRFHPSVNPCNVIESVRNPFKSTMDVCVACASGEKIYEGFSARPRRKFTGSSVALPWQTAVAVAVHRSVRRRGGMVASWRAHCRTNYPRSTCTVPCTLFN